MALSQILLQSGGTGGELAEDSSAGFLILILSIVFLAVGSYLAYQSGEISKWYFGKRKNVPNPNIGRNFSYVVAGGILVSWIILGKSRYEPFAAYLQYLISDEPGKLAIGILVASFVPTVVGLITLLSITLASRKESADAVNNKKPLAAGAAQLFLAVINLAAAIVTLVMGWQAWK